MESPILILFDSGSKARNQTVMIIYLFLFILHFHVVLYIISIRYKILV